MPAMHDDGAGQPDSEPVAAADMVETAPTMALTMPAELAAPAAPVQAAAPARAPMQAAPPAVATPAVPVAAAEPARIKPFELPLTDLQALAAGAGLEWVGSDADKVSAAQAAIAATPKPAHVPREPRPAVVVDEGPLVLVETKKDLSQLKLPFEQQQQPGA